METGTKITFGLLEDTEKPWLLKLFKDIYPQLEWSESYLRWQYDENPAGKAQSWVARRGAEILGNYTAVPFEVWIQGETRLAWRVQDVLTRPAYAGLGIYHRLSQMANAVIKNEKHPVNFALPNERSHNGFIRHGWFDAFRIPLRIVRDVKDISIPAGAAAKPITRFDLAAEQTWKARAGFVDFALQRSAFFLNWRYFAKPGANYFAFRISVGSDDLVLVLKYYDRENGERWAHLCDMFQSGPGESLYEEGLRCALRFAQENGCTAFSCWWPAGELDGLWQRYGFQLQEDLTRWLVLSANGPETLQTDLSAQNRWHFTMGDSDVY